jgi:hypothetical protein
VSSRGRFCRWLWDKDMLVEPRRIAVSLDTEIRVEEARYPRKSCEVLVFQGNLSRQRMAGWQSA